MSIRSAIIALPWAMALAVSGCSPTVTARPGPDPTEFILTRVAVALTEGAGAAATPSAVSTLLPSRTQAPPTATPTATASPTQTPPALTATPSPSPFPTLDLARFPRPPEAFAGDPHFHFYNRPIGEGGNVFVASNYRYGSTLSHQLETHHGVEFANGQGAPIVAVAPGVVYYAGSDAERQFGPIMDFYGNLVVLGLSEPWFGRPVFALYGHMDQVLVSEGQAVGAGEVLGTVGATGVAYGPHLHLEARVDNPDSYWSTRNPELWLAPGPGRGTVAVRVTNADGQHLPDMRVALLCSDGAPRFVDTYWDPGVTPDDVYGENAALTDIPAGYCEFRTTYQGQELFEAITVQAGAVNFVWLRP
jgi:murein DD-endopeptidase MepM/ murein hydrolase activator NlpD